jgi:hypothetical protein
MRTIKSRFVVAEEVSLPKLGPPPAHWNKAVLAALFAFFILPVFLLSGCDAINSILNLDDEPESSTNTGEGALEPLLFGDGDEPEIIPVDENDPSKGFYEIHTFRAREDQNTFTLTLSLTRTYQLPPGAATIQNIDYFIVAGGGGGGYRAHNGLSDFGGGGGAGGLLYQTGQTLVMGDSGSVTVVVGRGGAGGTASSRGGDGEPSTVGNITVPGGGGGSNGATTVPGNPGGSGGGGPAGVSATFGNGGAGADTLKNTDPSYSNIKGHGGGKGYKGTSTDWGGGGGGAGGPGVDGQISSGGEGGAPWVPTGDDVWVTRVGATEFSRGGRGGYPNSPTVPGANYGDGGSSGDEGGAGHDGIVVIRFLRSAPSAPETQAETSAPETN